MPENSRFILSRAIPFVMLAAMVPAGCAAVALPFRVTADVLRVVPVVGGGLAVPFDAVGEFIDN